MSDEDEKNKGQTGKILLVLLPLLIIPLVILIVCSLIATIIRVQTTTNSGKGEIRPPFTYGSRLEEAIRCIRNDKFGCLKGAMDEEKKRVGITGWKKKTEFPGEWAIKYATKCNLSLTEAFLLMFFDIIGSVFFPLSSKQTLDKLFNAPGQPPPLGIGGAILIVLKLAVVFYGFIVMMPILTLPLGIGGGILSLYLQQGLSGYNYAAAFLVGLIGLPGTYVMFNVIARLLGIGGNAGVKFSTVSKNFMKHFGWLIVFIFIISEIILVTSNFGTTVPTLITGAVSSGLALLFIMIKDKKLFYKVKE